jgi:serine/threonine-protein kinase HipA
MRQAKVFRNGVLAGTLIQNSKSGYEFLYDDNWFSDNSKPAISMTLPKSKKSYESTFLFPFFFNMLSEGYNKKLQCRKFKLDENDYFGLLIATASNDTIGAITVLPDNND